jgi:N-acetylglucosaminyldiphosphoundecaprenol N-acetyl-beta-D-mannosaminyltransferase
MSQIRIKNISLVPLKTELSHLPEQKLLINTINAHSYNTARKDAAFAEALLKGEALIPDGAGVVKAIRFLRGEHIKRTAGWDLFVWKMQ